MEDVFNWLIASFGAFGLALSINRDDGWKGLIVLGIVYSLMAIASFAYNYYDLKFKGSKREDE